MGGRRQFKTPGKKQHRKIKPGDKVVTILEVPGVTKELRECTVLYVHPKKLWCTVQTKKGIRFSPWTEDVQKVG